jgi:hypothetical protein
MRRTVSGFGFNCLETMAVFCLIAFPLSHAQQTVVLAKAEASTAVPTPASTWAEVNLTSQTANLTGTNSLQDTVGSVGPAPTKEPGNRIVHWFKRPVESELAVEGLVSFGHYKIFATDYYENLYTAGVEYDRHSWGTFLGAQMDYVAEILPLTLLRQPADPAIWGAPQTTARETLPGLAISPIGLRMMWRDRRSFRPYFLLKGGVIAFDKKALSPAATYEDFTMQTGFGMQARLTQRLDLRVGLSDFHFSNAFMVPMNPGVDMMNCNGGIVFHFGPRPQW